MISSSWGAPAAFTKGFSLEDVTNGFYGRHLYVYSWPGGELKQTLDLGSTGLLPLEVSNINSISSLIDVFILKNHVNVVIYMLTDKVPS